jgi:hypothetical protein
MRRARSAVFLGLLAASPLLACGAPQARSPEGAPLGMAPAKRENAVEATVRAKRPEELGVWLHVDDPDALVELTSARPMLQLGAADEEIGRWLSVIDLTKPVDVVVTTSPPKAKLKKADDEGGDVGPPKPGLEVAARFRVKDVAKAIAALETAFDVTTEGSRVRAVKKKSATPSEHDEDGASASPATPPGGASAEPARDVAGEEERVLVCDFGGVRTGAEFAVCGTPAAVDAAGPWLQTGPRPPESERLRTATKARELARLTAYAAPLRPFLASKPKDSIGAAPKTTTAKESAKAFEDTVADLDAIGLEVAAEAEQVTFAFGWRYGTSKSRLTRAVFAESSGTAPTDAFLRITEDASGAIFLPGGGPLAAAMTWVAKDALDDLAPDKKAALSSMLPVLMRMAERPIEAGYGIDAARVKKALAAVRTSKDPVKTTRALADALAGYEMARIPVEIASVEALTRGYAKSENDKEKEKQKEAANTAATAASVAKSKGVKAESLVSHDTTHAWAVRPVPAKVGLPKGSFALDDSKKEWRTPGAWQKSTGITFFVPGPGAGSKSATWIVTCTEEAACVERAKIAIAEKPPTKTTRDVLFQQPGLVLAGDLSTLVGAFAIHRLQLQLGTNPALATMGAGATPVSGATLAEIEHHLEEPKLLLPFVLLAQPRGDGGLATFEIRGELAAWKELGGHASAAASSSFMLLGMAVALALAATP